jgi:ketosteroid isomerase-like protein
VIDEQQWLAAWNSQTAEPIMAIADPEIEVHAVTLGIEGRHYQGHDGLRQWMRDIRNRFGARTQAEAVVPLGEDAVMVRGTLFISDGFGGEDEQQRFAMVVHLRDGKAIWIGTFFSSADAKAAYESGVTGQGAG